VNCIFERSSNRALRASESFGRRRGRRPAARPKRRRAHAPAPFPGRHAARILILVDDKVRLIAIASLENRRARPRASLAGAANRRSSSAFAPRGYRVAFFSRRRRRAAVAFARTRRRGDAAAMRDVVM